MKNKKSTSILMLIMSVVIVCLSFGMFSFKFSKNSQAIEEVANAVSANGGAMYIGAGSKVTLGSDCEISGITGATNGGAIYVAGELTIDGATIKNCSATHGGAIYIGDTGKVTINSGTISKCSATQYGGAIANRGGTLIINGGTIDGCSAIYHGGAISDWNGTTTISGGTFSNNDAKVAGVLETENSAVDITGGSFEDNTADDKAGAIFFYGSRVSVSGASFSGNSASAGGALAFYDEEFNPSCSGIDNCDFISNNASQGGAIYFEFTGDFDYLLTQCCFESNSAQDGGSVYVYDDGYGATINFQGCDISYGEADNGGAIYFDGTINELLAENCFFGRNSASVSGGSIYSYGGSINECEFDENESGGEGGAISHREGTLYISGNTFNACKSIDGFGGGAIEVSGGTVEVEGHYGVNTLSACEAQYGSGGAILVSAYGCLTFEQQGELDINECTAYVNGGAICYTAGGEEVEMFNTIIGGCTAMESGGGIYIPDGMMLNCGYVEIYDCIANEGGAIYMSLDVYIALGNCDIYSNEATYGANIYVVGQSGIQIQSGTYITAPVTGNSIEINDRADISIVAGAVVGSANPASNDRIYSGQGREVYISYSGGSLYSIIDVYDTEPSVSITFKPTVALTLEVGSTAQFSSSSYMDLSNIKSATSGYSPSASGTLVSLIQAATYTITVNMSGSGGLSVNSVVQAKAQKTYSVTSGNTLLFTMTLSAAIGLTGPDGTTLWTYYGYRLKNSAGTQLSTGLNKNTYSTTKSYTFTPTKTETITVEFYTSDGNIGSLFISESLEETEKTQEQDIYFDDKKFLLKTVNINSQDLYSQEKYVINANRMEIA